MTTVAAAELKIANDLIARLVDVMRRSDLDYVVSHDDEETTDEDWDEALEEAEDWLEEQAEEQT